MLFTQTSVDEDGHLVRDPGSSIYLATLQSAPHFGSLVYTEARRRGSAHAQQVAVLGDGAPWIWNLASQHFHGATQTVDLDHAKEHVHALTALNSPPPSAMCAQLGSPPGSPISTPVTSLRCSHPAARPNCRAHNENMSTRPWVTSRPTPSG